MSKRDDSHFLVDMLVNSRLVIESTRGVSKDQFLANREKQDSVALRISLIGEAARYVTETTRQGLPELPWPKITGMRHRIAHDYNEIDLEVVWRVAETHAPQMMAALQRYLTANGIAIEE